MAFHPSFAQTTSLDEPDYLTKHSYTEEMKTFYLVEDISSLTKLDKLKIIPKSQTKRYEKYLNENNEIITVVQFMDSENIYEDWMTIPHKIIVDTEGVTSFSESGEVLSASPHSDEYLSNNQSETEKSLFVNLPDLITEEQISNFENQGFIVYTDNNGTTSISGDGIELQFNPSDQSTEKIITKDGGLVHTERKIYKTLVSGEQVVDTLITKDYLTFYNGVCAEKITIKVNTEHEVFTNTGEQRSSIVKSQNNLSDPLSFQIFPIPVGDILTISARSAVPPRSWFSISIFDTNGRNLLSEKKQNPFPYRISTDQLPSGTYMIKIEGKEVSWIERFIKL